MSVRVATIIGYLFLINLFVVQSVNAEQSCRANVAGWIRFHQARIQSNNAQIADFSRRVSELPTYRTRLATLDIVISAHLQVQRDLTVQNKMYRNAHDPSRTGMFFRESFSTKGGQWNRIMYERTSEALAQEASALHALQMTRIGFVQKIEELQGYERWIAQLRASNTQSTGRINVLNEQYQICNN
jgi:hypothetical protein